MTFPAQAKYSRTGFRRIRLALLYLVVLPTVLLLGCDKAEDEAAREARVDADAYDKAIERDDLPEAIEGREFLAGPFSGVPATRDAVETAYSNNAKRVWVSYEELDGRVPLNLIIELPEEAGQRKALFKAMNDFSREKFGAEDGYADQGSKYLMFFLEGTWEPNLAAQKQ